MEARRAQGVSSCLIPGGRATDTSPLARPSAVVLGLLGFVAVWTLYGAISGAGLSLPGDMAEAYVWGQQFRFGYNQHPPFWAWIAGVWFMALPHRNWAFYLLAVINSAIGLVGCWWLIGRFAKGWERRAAFTLLLLTPFYTFLCYKYNANTIFLSIWPWTLYCFLASMESAWPRQALWFGIMMAIALMSKYYAVTLALTCFAASLVHPRRRDWYRSSSPWIAGVVCAVLCLPHVIWLVRSDAPPIDYTYRLTGIGLWRTISFDAQFVISVVLFHIVVVGLVVAAALASGGLRWTVRLSAADRVLAVLVLAPVLLTVIFGLALELKVSSNMTVGAFPLAPLLIMRVLQGADPRRLFRWARVLVGGVSAAVLLASPLIARTLFFNQDDPDAVQPRQELAQFVTLLWHKETGTRLRVVAGSDPYENAIGFYSADHPAVFIAMSDVRAPWVTHALMVRDGFLSVCVHEDKGCAIRSKIYQPPSTRIFHITLSHAFWGYKNPPVTFDIYLVPPVPAAARTAIVSVRPPRG
jgi:4-amino-4-deoxy-L-arabinose transferase-like glycosyltransferase